MTDLAVIILPRWCESVFCVAAISLAPASLMLMVAGMSGAAEDFLSCLIILLVTSGAAQILIWICIGIGQLFRFAS